MYSMVLMAALQAGADAPAWFFKKDCCHVACCSPSEIVHSGCCEPSFFQRLKSCFCKSHATPACCGHMGYSPCCGHSPMGHSSHMGHAGHSYYGMMGHGMSGQQMAFHYPTMSYPAMAMPVTAMEYPMNAGFQMGHPMMSAYSFGPQPIVGYESFPTFSPAMMYPTMAFPGEIIDSTEEESSVTLPNPSAANYSNKKRARLVVDVPEDAKLFIDEQPIKAPDGHGAFKTPHLDSNQEYFYDLRVEVVRDGRVLTASKKIVLRAGDEAHASFTGLGRTMTASR